MDDSHNIFLSSSIFLVQGLEIKDQADIDAVKKECKFVGNSKKLSDCVGRDAINCVSTFIRNHLNFNHYQFVFINVEKQNIAPKFKPRNTVYLSGSLEKSPPKSKFSFTQEIDRAAYIYGKTSDLVRSFMEDVHCLSFSYFYTHYNPLDQHDKHN
jgi:hypothetical protein